MVASFDVGSEEAGFLAKKVPYVPGSAGGSKARVVEGMEWKPIWISHAGLCPADDGKCHGTPIEGYAWLVGVGKRGPMGSDVFGWPLPMARWLG